MFYQLFLGDCCLGKQCYEHCKYKYDHSSADIRIGDLWGNTYKDNEDGVSGAVAFTAKGNDILKKCNCELVEHTFDVVAEGQMNGNPNRPLSSYLIMNYLKKTEKIGILDIINILNKCNTFKRRISYLGHPLSLFTKIYKKSK